MIKLPDKPGSSEPQWDIQLHTISPWDTLRSLSFLLILLLPSLTFIFFPTIAAWFHPHTVYFKTFPIIRWALGLSSALFILIYWELDRLGISMF